MQSDHSLEINRLEQGLYSQFPTLQNHSEVIGRATTHKAAWHAPSFFHTTLRIKGLGVIDLVALRQHVDNHMQLGFPHFRSEEWTISSHPNSGPTIDFKWSIALALLSNRKRKETSSTEETEEVEKVAKNTTESTATKPERKEKVAFSNPDLSTDHTTSLFQHVIDKDGSWIVPPQVKKMMRELGLPPDTHKDICDTVSRLHVFRGLDTAMEQEIHTSYSQTARVVEVDILHFYNIRIEDWLRVLRFIKNQKAYRLYSMKLLATPSDCMIRVQLWHKNPIFDVVKE